MVKKKALRFLDKNGTPFGYGAFGGSPFAFNKEINGAVWAQRILQTKAMINEAI